MVKTVIQHEEEKMKKATQEKPTETRTATDFLYNAFKYFNSTVLRETPIQDTMICLTRKKGAAGYFWANQWTTRKGKGSASIKKIQDMSPEELANIHTHEISINPEASRGCSDKDVLSTLVHEMLHGWQQEYGKPSRNGYHNKQWADKMRTVGLPPLSLDNGHQNPDAGTGQNVTHTIDIEGLFSIHCDKFLTRGTSLGWEALPVLVVTKPKDKIKYTCSSCELKVWGKPDLNITCTDCDEQLEPED